MNIPIEIRSDYTDEQNYTHIDAWFSSDDNEQGRTIAIVCLDTKKVYYIDNTMRNVDIVIEEINLVIEQLN